MVTAEAAKVNTNVSVWGPIAINQPKANATSDICANPRNRRSQPQTSLCLVVSFILGARDISTSQKTAEHKSHPHQQSHRRGLLSFAVRRHYDPRGHDLILSSLRAEYSRRRSDN